MINSYKTLSSRYIKQDKKRTVLTLIGIILSLALISTVGLFVRGSEKSQIEQTKRTEGVSFHIMYKTYNDDILNKVSNNPNIKKYGVISNGEEIRYNDITFKKYYIDNDGNEILRYSLKEGNMPTKDNEICIDEWAKAHINLNLKIGDKITLDNKEYTIVGFLKTDEFLQRQKISRAITFNKSPKNGQLMVEINPEGNFDETLELLRSLSDKDNIQENYSLIGLNQIGSDRPIVVVAVIVITIIVTATIIVIYNSFQINVAERMKQFGLLRSIGATIL